MTKEQDRSLGLAHFTEMGIVDQLATSAFERVLPDGLTVAQFALLHHMVRLGDGWGPARLAAAFQVTKGAMTGLVGKLETKGFLTVVAHPVDRRSKCVVLTDAGRAACDTGQTAARPLFAQLAGVLTPAEAEALLATLIKLRRWMDAAR